MDFHLGGTYAGTGREESSSTNSVLHPTQENPSAVKVKGKLAKHTFASVDALRPQHLKFGFLIFISFSEVFIKTYIVIGNSSRTDKLKSSLLVNLKNLYFCKT